MPGTRPQGAGYPANTEVLEAFLQGKLRTEGLPRLSVVVVKGNRIVWERGFGFADLATSRPRPRHRRATCGSR